MRRGPSRHGPCRRFRSRSPARRADLARLRRPARRRDRQQLGSSRRSTETYRASNLLPVLDHVLRATQPDVLHVHNLLNLSFDLPRAGARARRARRRHAARLHAGVPVGGPAHPPRRAACLPHDRGGSVRAVLFRVAVSGADGLRARARRPGGCDRAPRCPALRGNGRRASSRVLRRAGGGRRDGAVRPPREIDARLDAARAAASEFDLLVAPVAVDRRASFARSASAASARCRGLRFRPRRRPDPRLRRPRARDRLRVGFVGTLVWHKGVHVLIDAIRQMPVGSGSKCSIFGDTDTFPDYTAELQRRHAAFPSDSWAASSAIGSRISTRSSTCSSCPRCGSRTRRS